MRGSHTWAWRRWSKWPQCCLLLCELNRAELWAASTALLYFLSFVREERPLKNRRGGKWCGSFWLQSRAFTAKNLLPLFICKQTERHFDPRDMAAWHYLCKEPTERVLASLHTSTRPVCHKGKTLQWSFPLWKHSKKLQTAHSRCYYFILLFFNLKRGLELPAGFIPNILELFFF